MPKSPETPCGHTSETHPEKKELSTLSDGETERIAQTFLDESEAAVDLFKDLKKDLYGRWSISVARNPKETELRIARTLRKLVLAAVSSQIYTQILYEIVPMLEQDQPFLPRLSEANSFASDPIAPVVTGQVATCAASLNDLFLRHGLTYLNLASHEDHPDHNLTVAYQKAQGFLRSTSPYPIPDSHKHWENVSADNARVFTTILLDSGHSYTASSGVLPDKKHLMKNAIRSLDPLTWPATGKVPLARKLFHNPEDNIGLDFPNYEDVLLADNSEFIPDRCPALLPSHVTAYDEPSVISGPWHRPGFCPGVPVLQPRLTEEREIIEKFFQYFEKRFGLPILRPRGKEEENKGAFDRVTVGLLITLLYAESTIFEHWPKAKNPPVSPRHHTYLDFM